MENDGDLARDGDLRLLHADPLGKLHPPGFEGGPLFGPIKQNGRRLEQSRCEEAGRPIAISCRWCQFPLIVCAEE